MLLRAHTLKTLEFEQVRELLARRAACSLGARRCRELTVAATREEVTRRQVETAEGRVLLERGLEPPFGGVSDVGEAVSRAARGGRLGAGELLDVADTVEGGARLRRFLQQHHELTPQLAALADYRPPAELAAAIRRCVNDRGELVDDASPALGKIRRRLRVAHDRVRSTLEQLLRSPQTQRYLQEPIVTVRQNRYVVPVRYEFRQQVPGVVHDQSASGATLFVEPLEVLELGNEVRRLQAEERDEVDRILLELSARVGERAPDLERLLDAVGHLDHVFARARLAKDQDASRPELDEHGHLELRGARHPLLAPQSQEVVPIDVELGHKFRTMVITGPNTGGKTVTLKTVGLLCLMAQAGLQIPALPGSRLPVYRDVYCDIGDEQSIQQNLSTFSAHLTNTVAILREVGPGCLVLLDEVGAGTDPTEGSVLAMALLERLQELGAHTMATTHYGELKLFAHQRPGMVNACVEFDPETLRPTYRLLIGVPGRSNALDIALRLGLAPDLVARARQLLSREETAVDDLLRSVERERAALVAERSRLERELGEVRRLAADLEGRLAAAAERDRRVAEKVRGEVRQIVAQARRQAEALLKELREARRESPAMGERRRVEIGERVRRGLEEIELSLDGELDAFAPTPPDAEEPVDPGDIRPGARVVVRSLGQAGVVLSGDASREVQVQVGAMRVVVPASDLARAPAAEEVVPSTAVGHDPGLAKVAAVSTEIHLRGKKVEEAILLLDKYLDDACLAGLSVIRVVHGRGTGALRQAVRAYLETHPRVARFWPAGREEGGEGATVVELTG